MNHQAPPGRHSWPNLSPQRKACMRDAARLLGASDPIAQQFADVGTTLIEDFALHVLPAGPDDGPWVACVRAAPPSGVSEAAWSDALLLANAQAMLLSDWAFGMEDGSDAVLVAPLSPDMLDARFLASHLEGMVGMCRAVREGVSASLGVTHGRGALQ